MSETKFHSRMRVVAAWALAGVFVVAAYGKIGDPAGFAADINNYHLKFNLVTWGRNAFAIIMPWWELIAALALLHPAWRRAGALITGCMGIMFFVVVTQALIRGLDIHCGCFGHGEKAAKAGAETLLTDAFVIIASWYVLLGAEKRQQPAAFEVVTEGAPESAAPAVAAAMH